MADIVQPKPKKCRFSPTDPLPVISEGDSIYKFRSYFNGYTVIVCDKNAYKLITMGCFGKGNLSRSYPHFHNIHNQNNVVELLRKRQFLNRKLCGKHGMRKKIIVLPDSDSETEYFANIQPKFEIDESGIEEDICLTLEEAFFLANSIECLQITYNSEILDNHKLFQLFSKTDSNFVINYIVYNYFRSKNWVCKCGNKFGGDFLLYKQGPSFYHASYAVIIDVLDEHLERIEKFIRRSMDLVSLMGLNRLCETTGKELLICQLIWKEGVIVDFNNLSNFVIKEVLMKRWISTQERQKIVK